MNRFVRVVKFAAALFAAAAVLAATPAPSNAATCSVRLHIVKAGLIVGLGGGNGTLYCHGQAYRLNLGGIGVGSLGIAAVDLVGTATNLHRPSDIAGTYGAAGVGATFVAGAQAATLQNEKGVVLNVHGVQAGFQISIGLAGLTIALR